MADLLVFSQSVEGLVLALGDRLDASMSRLLAEAGIDVSGTLKPTYPLEAWIRALHRVSRSLWPEQPPEVALFELGRQFIHRGVEHTVTGSGFMGLLRLLGPEKSMEHVPRGFRSGNNYTETRLVKRGPASYEMWVNRVSDVHFFQGICMAGMEVSGAQEPRVELVASDSEGATFRLAWRESSAPAPAPRRGL